MRASNCNFCDGNSPGLCTLCGPAADYDRMRKRDLHSVLPSDPQCQAALDDAAITVDAPDMVNNPPHYTSHPSGVECIQIVEHMGFNLGNVVKYLWRADEKGAPVEDLEKARFYLDREIARRKGGAA